MIKIEHTPRVLPPELGAVLAASGLPSADSFRSPRPWWARARWRWLSIELRIENTMRNPRTSNRALPAGLLSVGFVWAFTLVSASLFFLAAAMLNRLTLMLAPVALASVLLYSFSKRWTLLSHLLLGWCLSIAPTGAWIAVRGALDSPVPLLLSLVVMLWTAGFDVLYACQDYDFDVQAGLHSIPKQFGIARALLIARLLHIGAFVAPVALY